MLKIRPESSGLALPSSSLRLLSPGASQNAPAFQKNMPLPSIRPNVRPGSRSRHLTGFAATCLLLPSVATAQALTAAELGLPQPGKVLGASVQSIVALTGNQSAMTGNFRSQNEPDQSSIRYSIFKLQFAADLPSPASGWFAPAEFQFTGNVVRYQEKELIPIDSGRLQSKTTANLVSAGVAAYRPLDANWYLRGETHVHVSRLANSGEATGIPNGQALIDLLTRYKYLNTSLTALSLGAGIDAGWRSRPLADIASGPTWFVEGGVSPLWTRSVGANEQQHFSRLGTAGRVKAGIEVQPGWDIFGKPTLLSATVARHQFSRGMEPLGGSHMNEYAVNLVRFDRWQMGQAKGHGVSLAYMENGHTTGWRLQLSLDF